MGDDRADIHHKSRVCLLMENISAWSGRRIKSRNPLKSDHPAPVSSLLRAHPETVQNAQEPNPYQRDAQGNPVPPLSDKEKEFRKREIERIKRLPVQEVLKLMREGSSHRSFIETRNEVFGDEVKHLEKP